MNKNDFQMLKEKGAATAERLSRNGENGEPFFQLRDKVEVLEGGSYSVGTVAGHGWMAGPSDSGQWFYRVQFQGRQATTVRQFQFL